MSLVIGIDLGSRTTKIVEYTGSKLQNFEIFDTRHDPLTAIKRSLQARPEAAIVATGYGRHLLRKELGAEVLTEIKACAKGVRALLPEARTILDVGGQDCKVIHLDKSGRVADFEMNDRCAAGTGKFLEVMAQTFDSDMDSFADLACSAEQPVSINSMCTVFAESEVISLITSGRPKNQIALGLHSAVADRLCAMLRKFPLQDPIVFVGGGARNQCLHRLLEQKIEANLWRPQDPQLVTACGAALLAKR